MQSSMQRMLGLESQLQHIDYTKSNFVHADLSPRQMQQKMAERGDTVWSVGMRAFNEMMQKQSELGSSGQAGFGQAVESFEDLFGLLSNPAKLKRMLATQFASGGALEAGLGGSLNKILVEDRNQARWRCYIVRLARAGLSWHCFTELPICQISNNGWSKSWG